MARLTLYPPAIKGRVNGYSDSISFRYFDADATPVPASTTSTKGLDATRDNAGVTILDVRVHALSGVEVEFTSPGDPSPMTATMLCIVLEPGEEKRVREFLPLGMIVERHYLKDGIERPCIRICDTYLRNEWDRIRVEQADADARGEILYDWIGKGHTWPYQDAENMELREDRLRALVSKNAQQHLMVVHFDMRDERDLDTKIFKRAFATNWTANQPQFGCRVYDSLYRTDARLLAEKRTSVTIRGVVEGWREETETRKTWTIQGFTALGANHKTSAIDRFRRFLDVDGVKSAPPPASGRRIVLDDELPSFPDATRCTIGTNDTPLLAFGINADRGSYHAVNAPFGSAGWNQRDFMLIHRDVESWRFIFWCYFDLHIRTCEDTQGVMLMPYIVRDSECAQFPTTVSPQRGMPLAVSRAVAETPYCAAAISHGLSRLRYARSQIDVFNRPMGLGADLHHPEFGALFRSKPKGRPLVFEPYRGASRKALDTKTHDARGALSAALKGLRPTRTEWETKVEVDTTSVLGTQVHRPRAVMLDM